MAAKYFVWGEGVWRELDVASGHVTGWRRRARFVFVRRGRLVLARRHNVLRALQALAAGQAGAAADGPRLPHRSKSVHRKHRHKSPSANPVPTPAPAVPSTCMHQHHCCAHKRCVDNDKQTPSSTPATVAPPAPAPAAPTIPSSTAGGSLARRSTATQCGTGAIGFTINVPHKTHAPPVPPAPPAPPAAAPNADSSSSDEFSMSASLRAKFELNALISKHSSVTKPTAATSKKPTSVKDKSGNDRTSRAKKRARVLSSDQTESSASEGRAVCKELLVSEEDVAAMRAFVRARRPSAVQRFDTDEEYKRMLFYAINPLVEVERCAQLDRMLAAHEEAALPHFAARLGLTPRSEAPAPAPARPRTRPGAARNLRELSTSTDTDKENKEEHSSSNKMRSEVVDDVKKSPQLRPGSVASEPAPARVGGLGVSERGNKQKQDVIKTEPLTNGNVSNSSKPKRAASPPASKKKATPASDVSASSTLNSVKVPPGTHVISKRASQANAKEYSNLEDHAIVAWVSSGARATQVSGNLLWRDLEQQYERLTGRARSWHSLRNRYLRYILPSLGALHLPTSTVSRLRAAAATGVIKTSQRPARRHSIFKEPVRGASSRLPRSAASSDGETPAPDTAETEADDDAGPSSPKRRSLRLRQDAAEKESRSTPGNKAGGSQASQSQRPTGSQAANSQQSASKEGGSQKSASKEGGSQKSASKEGGKKEARRSPRYSEVTRRFAARHRPPSPSPSRSSSRSPSPVPPAATRSRRLYNPNANV